MFNQKSVSMSVVHPQNVFTESHFMTKSKKKINISKVKTTVSGNRVRDLHFKKIHLKSSINFIERIYGEVYFFDELTQKRNWIKDSWDINGKSDALESDSLIEFEVKEIENQLNLF